MEKHIPVESRIVDGFKPTQYELQLLARHYLEKVRQIEFDARFLGVSGSYKIRMNPFAYRRLATIKNVLGEERFREAIARTEEQWKKIFTEAEEIESNLEPCKRCGAQRDYNHYASPHIPDGYCGACDPAKQGPSDSSGVEENDLPF